MLYSVTHSSDYSSTLVYLENAQNYEVNESSNAGQVILVNCANITVKNLNLSKHYCWS